jgi:hypothetical protein
MRTVTIPRRSITGLLVYGRVWRRPQRAALDLLTEVSELPNARFCRHPSFTRTGAQSERTGRPQVELERCRSRQRSCLQNRPKFHHALNGTADAMVYSVEGNSNTPENLRSFWFDCQGHYRDQTGGIGPTLFAPPRSVAGMLSNI